MKKAKRRVHSSTPARTRRYFVYPKTEAKMAITYKALRARSAVLCCAVLVIHARRHASTTVALGTADGCVLIAI